MSGKRPSPAVRDTAKATTDIAKLLPAGDANAIAFLRAALEADPSTAKGKAALRAAQTAAVRLARDLRRRAKEQGGVLGAQLGREANESYYRAVLAKELPRLIEILRRPRAATPAAPAAPAPLLAAPPAPTDVTAAPGVRSAIVHWQQAPSVVTGFKVTPFIGAVAQTPTLVAGSLRETPILGLTAGTAYRFQVIATNVSLDSPPSELSAPVTPTGAPAPLPGGAPLDFHLPPFSSDPALIVDRLLVDPLRPYIADASRISQKWRYEYLKVQAIAAAREAMQYETHIAQLMAMALGKLGTAEEIFNNTLLQVLTTGHEVASDLATAANAPELDSLLAPLGDTAAQALLLPKLIAFLVERGPIEFWIGLFEAVISDLASVFPGFSTGFGRTRSYLKRVFQDPLSGIQSVLDDAANDLLSRLDVEVGRMIAPLRVATNELIAGTRKAMADIFEGFDVTLLMTPARVPGQPDIPDADPLSDLYAQLDAQVNELSAKVKKRITDALLPLTDPASAGGLFVTIVITFLVLPILAFLVISLAGGPFSAALLAAAVLLAAEELLHLLVEWLAGPLLKKLTELQEKLTELVGKLQAFFAVQAALVQVNDPADFLSILASQLRELRDFLPQAFLEEAAGVLQEARNVVLRTATQLGLAAEQALGAENASAFEAVGDDLLTNLAQAPQLPGGADASRLAGAVLLRDFGRLEEQRTAIRDGKEIEFTHRISLLRLLGGDPTQWLQQFIQRRELLVSLTERDLVDRMFPGMYRVLIKDVRATGILGGAIDPRLHGIPLTLTHLGESRTRIKKSANPFAPPLELPTCFPGTPELFARRVVGPRLFDPPFGDDLDDDEIDGALPLLPFVDPLESQIMRIFGTFENVVPVRDYGIAFFALLFFFQFDFDRAAEFITRQFRQPLLLAELPESVGRAAVTESCGLVDPASLVGATHALLDSGHVGINNAILGALLTAPNGDITRPPNLRIAAASLADLLRGGLDVTGPFTGHIPGLTQVAKEAWQEGRQAFLRRIARWGDVDLEEDPDPQVRALGFARLVRRTAPEAMVFNLFPPSAATQVRADSAAGPADGPPFMPASTLQYRPFENRGIEGDFLLRLESLDDDSILPLGAGSIVSQLSANLTDVVLDVTLRGCYDRDLAETVRASRRQTAAAFNVASRIAGAVGPIALPESVARAEAGASELRTVRYSLRSHRDKTLQALTAAVLANSAPPAALTSLIEGKSVLARDAAFQPLDPAVTTFTVELSSAPLANTAAALQGLVGTLRVSPADLGLDASILAGREVVEPARLTSLGVAVIPMPDGTGPADQPEVDPMNIRLQVSGPLGDVLPGFAALTPLPQRLKMTVPAASNPPLLADLFAAATPPAVTLDLAGAFGPPPIIYDVIVSMTFRTPAVRVRTTIDQLR